MEVKIESSESPEKKHPLQPPPDYTSRGMRRKLWTLVFALMFVLFMMNEARKPENWRWMGFDESGKQKEQEEEKKFIFEEAQYDTQEPASNSELPQNKEKTSERESELDTESLQEKESVPKENDDEEDVVLAQPEFWKLLYRQLELSEQRELFSQLRALRERSLDGETPSDHGSLIEKIDGFVKVRMTEILNDLSLIAEGQPKREVLNIDLQRLQFQWEQQLKPVLAGEPFRDRRQRESIRALQAVLDQAAYAVVKDYTSPTKATDAPAWLRTWEKIIYESGEQTASEVKPIQLMAEAEFFRGKPVSIGGELRGVEVVPSQGNPLGVPQFYSIWVRPDVASIQPFNAYVLELPKEVQLSEERYTAFEDLQITLSGCFFKVRTYKDRGGTISETPLLLARSINVSKVDAAEVLPPTVRNGWTPSRELLIAFFVGMPLLAAVIAFVVFRGTVSRRMRTGATAASQINHSLEELAENPNVETVKEKLVRMESEGMSR